MSFFFWLHYWLFLLRIITFDYPFGIIYSVKGAVSTTLVAPVVSLLVTHGDTSLTKEGWDWDYDKYSETINQVMRATVNNGNNMS